MQTYFISTHHFASTEGGSDFDAGTVDIKEAAPVFSGGNNGSFFEVSPQDT